jgi:hypothetical protein
LKEGGRRCRNGEDQNDNRKGKLSEINTITKKNTNILHKSNKKSTRIAANEATKMAENEGRR